MNEQVAANPLGTERVGKLMIRYAIPSIISIVVNSLYNMVDQIFIGQGVGYLGNAATNVIMPLTTILMAIAFMLGDGAAAYMSLNLGKNRPDDAARGVGNLITLTIGTGSILLILFQLFSGAALRIVRGYGGKSPLCTGLWPYYCAGLSLLRCLLRLRERDPGGRASQSQHDRLAHRLCHKYHFGPDLHFCVPVGRQRRRLGHHPGADLECGLFCCLHVPV